MITPNHIEDILRKVTNFPSWGIWSNERVRDRYKLEGEGMNQYLYQIKWVDDKPVISTMPILSGPNSKGWYKVKLQSGKVKSIRPQWWFQTVREAIAWRLYMLYAEDLTMREKGKRIDGVLDIYTEYVVELGKMLGRCEEMLGDS